METRSTKEESSREEEVEGTDHLSVRLEVQVGDLVQGTLQSTEGVRFTYQDEDIKG